MPPRSRSAVASGAVAALAVAIALPALAGPPRPAPRRTAAPARAIAIVVNGAALPRDPAPRSVGGHLLVPVTRIWSALGIQSAREGDRIVAAGAGKTIVVRIGSDEARVDDRDVRMEARALELDGATYVPLRFVADALGAFVSYDPRAGAVTIVSSLVGRNPGLEHPAPGGGTELIGAVSAVDLQSAPESITLVGRNAEERTIAITSDARITIEDVGARTSRPSTLAEVRPGDDVAILVRRDGRVADVRVRYETRAGTIAAVSGNAFVLANGYVVTPDRQTAITLDGKKASLGDLKPGDAVAVRLNPTTLEKREITATTPAGASTPAASPSASAAPLAPKGATASATITDLALGPRKAVRGGETLTVTMTGSAGGRATFDVGTFATALPMTEAPPGRYTGSYAVPAAANFGVVTVTARLALGEGAPARSDAQIAISSTPPQIVQVAPSMGETVANAQPSIFATFQSPSGVPIDPGSIQLLVNGADVSANATRGAGFVTYSPPKPLPNGRVTVTVSVGDQARNVTTRSWSFMIGSR